MRVVRTRIARAAAVYAVTAILLVPILWMLTTSVRPPLEYVSDSISLIPSQVTLEHYRELIRGDVLGKAWNSLVVAVGTMVLALAAGFPAAYALVRLRFPKGLDLAFLMFVLLVKLTPPISLAIPLYQVLRSLGLLDTLLGLIIVYQVYALPFAIWMLLGFVRDVPVEYEEAAMIDGASLPRRLGSIVLPVMAPGPDRDLDFRGYSQLERIRVRALVHPVSRQVHATHVHRHADHGRRDVLGQAFGRRAAGIASDPRDGGGRAEGPDARVQRWPEMIACRGARARDPS